MIIDTDVFIWLTRGNTRAIEFLDSIDEYHISDMTYMEVVQGTKNKQEFRLFKKMLEEMGVERIPLDPAISAKASELVEEYAHSHSVHAADSLIAATALVYELPIATGNIKHFSPIPELEIYAFSPLS